MAAWRQSPYGRIESRWRRDGKKLTLAVTIPANTTATIFVPAKCGVGVTHVGDDILWVHRLLEKDKAVQKDTAVYSVGSGHYEFASVLP